MLLKRRFILIALFCCLALSLNAQDNQQQGDTKIPAGSGLNVQDTKETGTVNTQGTVKTDEGAALKEKNPTEGKRQKKETETHTAKKKAEKDVSREKEKDNGSKEEKDDAPAFSGKGLILMDEGDETIRRIPGIVIAESDTMKSTIVQIPADVEEKAEPADTGGLFGMSSEKTETVAKVTIVILIFLIFLLYRMRSKRSGRRIVRTYLKK